MSTSIPPEKYLLPLAFFFSWPSHPIIEATKPIIEFHGIQSGVLLTTNPTSTCICLLAIPSLILNPSSLQYGCSDEPLINDFRNFAPSLDT